MKHHIHHKFHSFGVSRFFAFGRESEKKITMKDYYRNVFAMVLAAVSQRNT